MARTRKTPSIRSKAPKTPGKRAAAQRPAAQRRRALEAELAVVQSIQAGLASRLDIQGIYDLVGDKIYELFSAQSLLIASFEPDGLHLTGRYLKEKGRRHFPEAPRRGLTDFHRYLIAQNKTLIFKRRAKEQLEKLGARTIRGTEPGRSAVFVPLRGAGRVIGVISLQHTDREDAFSSSDVRLLETIAGSMGVALENARLFDETQRLLKEAEQRAAELAVINSVQQGLASQLDMRGIYELVGDKIRDIFNAQTVLIASYDETGSRRTGRYLVENGKRFDPAEHNVPINDLSRHLIRERKPLLLNKDADREIARLGGRTIPGTEPVRSAVFVPLLVGGRVTAVISLQNLDRENAFSEGDVRLLETLANSMSVALENARLFGETQRLLKETKQRTNELAILNSVGEAIARTLDAAAVTRIVGDTLREIFASETVIILLRNPQNGLIETAYEYDVNEGGYTDYRPPIKEGVGLVSKVMASGQPLRLGTIQEQFDAGAYAPPEFKTTGKTPWSESWMGVPISVGRNVLGVLVLAQAQPNAFTEDQEKLLQTLSSNVAAVLQNARLYAEARHARQDAEQANRAKSAFLANMSHELRTPLNAIIGFTRLVRRKAEGELPAKQLENLDKVLVSAGHLLELINTVLDIAKIEAGRMDVIAANFRLGSLIDLCINTSQPLVKPGVSLEQLVDDRINIVHSDQDKLRQILLNLLSNAAKFTSEGRILLSAHLEDDMLRIAVSDTGIGIRPEDLPRVFMEFQQADNSSTRKYGGTGLGLTISRDLAHLLGGELTAESEPGKGSTFTLAVPIHYEPRVAGAQPQEVAAIPTPEAIE